MKPVEIPSCFASDARWLVQAIDPGAGLCRLVAMDAADYRAAGFLDDRMLPNASEQRVVALDEVLRIGRSLAHDDAGWIFHIGHVGSTLVSRLLGEFDGTLCLREPRSIRDLTACPDVEKANKAGSIRRLMARRLSDTRRVIVKATSFTSEFGASLIGPSARAAFLFASPRNYIASILAGPNSIVELRSLEPYRTARLKARGIDWAAPLPTDAHRAAAAWICEMSSLDAAAESIGDRGAWFDFDQMLADMGGALARCACHFSIVASDETLREVVEGPLMRKYSKAMEYDYSPALRRDLLAEASLQHRVDIERAVDWLDQLAVRHPVVAGAIARSSQEI